MERPSAGALSGDATGAFLDDVSWTQLTPWRDEVVRLDRELRPDLGNLADLLRRIPVAIWGQLLDAPERHFGRADLLLPRMPDASLQKEWTGLSGGQLLRQSVAHIDQVVLACAEAGVRPTDAKVLDFGVGWGRLAMLWLKYSKPENLTGCDAWESSLEEARQLRVPIELILSDPLLETLPLAENSLDVVYAFSVFTSLGPQAFPSCLAGLGRMVRPGGVAVFTVRPPEYWSLRSDWEGALRDAEHREFYFHPYPGQHDYGDTSVSLSYLDRACLASGFEPPLLEWVPADPHQVVVRARRAPA
ncbi:class I SAM-dependent methyltransferase [Nocardioides sp. T2.26MG-1]|uniref:class I SAM-dependent methyltransferase n=1 Tax=Nocardioides sp. T2.26MG-1 TaxID=3041166 RepID=UPI0025400BF1|nr:class I SAM-dependent methyltransferase [Nocardioides sp. T2.26MG-1]